MTVRRITRMLGALVLAGVAGSAIALGSSSTATGSKDARFMRDAAADGLAEVQLGRLALEKASSAQVKELAQRIVDDHTKANDQLMTLAQRKQVTLPTEPMPTQQHEATRLKAMSGAGFDRAYARTMVQDHRKAIKLFGMASQTSTDSEVKQFASETLPVLKTHLQMAEQAAGSGMHHTATPMDHSGSMGMPASGSSTP